MDDFPISEAESRRRWVVKAAELAFGRSWPTEMAARTGLSRRAVTMWRDGQSSPKERVAHRLAALLVARAAEMVDLARQGPVPADAPEWALVFPAPGGRAGELMSESWRGPPPPTSGAPCPWAMDDATLEALVVSASALPPLPSPPEVELEGGGFSGPLDEPTAAAPPAPAPRPRGRPRKPPSPARIERALEDKGFIVCERGVLPRDPDLRSKREAAIAAGRVVYTDELMQHAGILEE